MLDLHHAHWCSGDGQLQWINDRVSMGSFNPSFKLFTLLIPMSMMNLKFVQEGLDDLYFYVLLQLRFARARTWPFAVAWRHIQRFCCRIPQIMYAYSQQRGRRFFKSWQLALQCAVCVVPGYSTKYRLVSAYSLLRILDARVRRWGGGDVDEEIVEMMVGGICKEVYDSVRTVLRMKFSVQKMSPFILIQSRPEYLFDAVA